MKHWKEFLNQRIYDIDYERLVESQEIETRKIIEHLELIWDPNCLMPEKIPLDLSKYLLSPMPGLLLKICVDEGQTIKAGEELAVVEAMKMENSLRASKDVKIKSILTTEGANLAVDQKILEFED